MNWKKIVQLACVHVGVSITVVPVTSTLNRVMIADMHLSATLVALLVALPYLLSPIQVAVGSWSDQHTLWGRHRSPWIVIGGLMAGFGSYLTAHSAYLLYDRFGVGLLVAIGAFLLWGIGVNVASVSYLSLVTDLTEAEEGWRSRAVSVMWTAMILSTIVVSLLISKALQPYTDMLAAQGEAALYNAFGAVWLITCVLILVGAGRLEDAPARDQPQRHNSADNPLSAYRLLSINPAARRFFVYLVLVLVSIHAQDVLLEPFAAEAFALPVAVTSRLTAIWGVGILLGLTAGLPIMRRMGKKRTANWGALVAASAFGAIIIAGVAHWQALFMATVFVLGCGGGLMTVSNLSFMLDMTVPQAAGLYMGAWGVANFAGQAVGGISSGIIRDLMLGITGNSLVGYYTVFGLEVGGLLVAVWLFRRITVEEFRREATVQLHDLLALVN